MEVQKGKSLSETPTWAVSGVVSVMVLIGFSINASLRHFGKWLDRTKRKSLLAALDKIKEELMLFGLLSLLMGHWTVYVAKICVKSSAMSSRFYPCRLEKSLGQSIPQNRISFSPPSFLNHSVSPEQVNHVWNEFCPEGSESFVSKESLEQLHRFLFVLGVTHVLYSFFTIALAMIKIYSWRAWESQAISMAILAEGSTDGTPDILRMRRVSTFVYHHTAHPWSQHQVLVWLICFGRQFWSSINRADYRALRLGFLTTHNLPLSYNFHNYMLRSMDEEFRDIVGISIPLWVFAIACMFLGFHGSNVYFWMSFLPAILAVEIMHSSQWSGLHQFNLRDELFWFGKPRFLLRLIQFISFQNAFEMATCIWSLWEVKDPSCYTTNHIFLVIRLVFGLVSQFWCSFITFPLYVIVTQMGSRFKKSIVSENVRESLGKWRRRVKARRGDGSAFTLVTATSTTSLDSMVDEIERTETITSSSVEEGCSFRYEEATVSHLDTYVDEEDQSHEILTGDEPIDLVPPEVGPMAYITCGDEHDSIDDICDEQDDGIKQVNDGSSHPVMLT